MEKRPIDESRPSPDDLLARITGSESGAQGPGRHKIFLGFAAGVGKTYEMLNEARRRKQRGQDVVIGYVETHKRAETDAQIGDLEIVPRKKIEYRGSVLEEMDTDAILERHPYTALVDELAHTNAPGSERAKRWQDVQVILDAGINVLSTVNVQHLESLNDTIHDITGIWVRETVPDQMLKEATEVKIVDITPRALIHRLERGDIYSQDRVPHALNNWFREGNLNALREIALREIAQEVDEDVTAYRKDRRIQETWPCKDRIMVCISPTQSSMRLIRRGWRMSQRLHGSIAAVYVENSAPGDEEQRFLQNDFALSDRLGIPVTTLRGDIASEIIRYARENQITQLVMGHSTRSRWQEFVGGSLVTRLARELRTIDILIVSAEGEA